MYIINVYTEIVRVISHPNQLLRILEDGKPPNRAVMRVKHIMNLGVEPRTLSLYCPLNHTGYPFQAC